MINSFQDNGYDISDYQQIMDVFGTMEEVEELIKAVHDRKMRIIFDLVLNHTSEYVFFEIQPNIFYFFSSS
jgi:glycosidase